MEQTAVFQSARPQSQDYQMSRAKPSPSGNHHPGGPEIVVPESGTVIKDEFARKYDYEHARRYYRKHHSNPFRRLSDWREKDMARRALKAIGNPGTILDLPCGTGRFWPLLAEGRNSPIIAADSSSDMLKVAIANCPAEFKPRINLLHTSAYQIGLAANSVDTVFSIRLLHHIGESVKRLQILNEFQRVARAHVLVSLWVDGNFKAWRRRRRELRDATTGRQRTPNRFLVHRREIEAEFAASGLEIVRYYDFLAGYSMWRLYLLKV